MQIKVSKIENLFSLVSVIGSIIAVLVCLFSTKDNGVKLIAILPALYMLSYLLCEPNRKRLNNISLAIINCSAFIRYVLSPTMIAITIEGGTPYSYSSTAIWLMAYELVCVYVVLAIVAKRLDVKQEKEVRKNDSYKIGMLNSLLLIFLVPCTLMFPSLLAQFSISSDTVKYVNPTDSGIINSFFSMGIWTLLVFVLFSLGRSTGRSHWKNSINILLAFSLAFFYLMSRAVSGSNVRRWQILSCGLAIVVVLIRTFPTKKNFIYTCGAIGIIAGVILGSFAKFGDAISATVFLNKYLSAASLGEYFGGPNGVTYGIQMAERINATRTTMSTLTDLFSGVPILSNLFNWNSYSTASLFLDFRSRTDLICPLLAQSFAHFGFIGAPILSIMMAILSVEFNRIANKTENVFSSFTCTELTVYFALFMELNTTIILGNFWVRLIYLFIQWTDQNSRLVINCGSKYSCFIEPSAVLENESHKSRK